MNATTFPSWNRLMALCQRLSEQYSCDPMTVFGDHGLYLYYEPSHMDHEGMPVNVSEFAWTGGDGVTYSLLDPVCEDSPVMMNVYMHSDEPDIIIGENLVDFLSLGCLDGWFSLEQFCYQYTKQSQYMDSLAQSGIAPKFHENPETNERMRHVLSELRNEFNLRPWSNHDSRLKELKLRYFHKLAYNNNS